MEEKQAEAQRHQVVMVGAGPSALAAAVYTTRENIDTVLIEKGVIGGLAAITDLIDNYPGFSKGIAGLELAEELRKQADRFGAKIELGEVESVSQEGELLRVKSTDGDMLADAVLIATGSDYRKLGIPGEKEYYGRGVHYCATCDGAFYKDKRIIVVGSGNSAAQESLFLTRFATHIDVLIRGDHWKASEVLVEEIEKNEKISVHYNVTSEEIIGENNLVKKVKAKKTDSNEAVEFETDGVFVFIGLLPNTQFLKDSDVTLDEHGFVVTDTELKTSVPGVFCSGDVRSGATMQIASAVGEGATAALKIREYLEQKQREQKN